jgi:uncharacterized membrane protein
MWLRIIGLLHLLHAPALILFPFYVNNQLADIIYINYFFLIMFSYTFINGECPISYVSKKIMDQDYFAGTDLEYYPEMRSIFNTDQDIKDYFTTTTIAYLFTLIYVINRSKIPFYVFILPTITLSYYFLFVKVYNTHKETTHFLICQEATKYITFFTNIFVIYHYSQNKNLI